MTKNNLYPIYIYAAERIASKSKSDLKLHQLLAAPCKNILETFDKSHIQGLFISCALSSELGGLDLIAPHVAHALDLNPYVDCLRVSAATCGYGPIQAAIYALNSGLESVLVVGGEKMSRVSSFEKTKILARVLSFEDQKNGLTLPKAVTEIAVAFQNHYKIEFSDFREIIRNISLRSLDYVSKNPHSQLFGKTFTPKIYDNDEKNPFITSLFRLYDCCPTSDGSGAMLLSKQSSMRSIDGKKVDPIAKISGFGLASDVPTISKRNNMTTLMATQYAAKKAYQAAGISVANNAWTTIDGLFVETHDPFAPLFILNLMDLGFFDSPESAINAFNHGMFDDELPVNFSGGVRAEHPLGGTGIIKMVDAVCQMNGVFDGVKVKNAKTAICQSIGGPGTQVGVAVVDRI